MNFIILIIAAVLKMLLYEHPQKNITKTKTDPNIKNKFENNNILKKDFKI